MQTKSWLQILLFLASPYLFSFNIVNVITTPTSPSNFNMEIDFQMAETIDDWLFGFYIPRTFITSNTQSINTGITLQIWDLATPSTIITMQYVTKTQNPTVFGDGTVNVFAPTSPFDLVEGHSYTFMITNSNQYSPADLSEVAQSFFVYDTTHQTFYNAQSPLSAYGSDINRLQNIGGYDYDAVQLEIQTHINTNWSDSAPLVAGNLADIYHLVPSPQTIDSLSGRGFRMLHRRTISLYNAFDDQSLQGYLLEDLNIHTIPVSDPASADIVISENNTITNQEGYTLQIQNNQIVIQSATDTGAFYGIQTLRQLWHQTLNLPALSISDAPRFKYRGMLLDAARHIYTVDQIETLIDAMAAQKLNTLHIHFTDDEGWRLGISSLLTSVLDDAELRGFVSDSTNVPGVFSQANLDKTNYVNDQQSDDQSNLIVSIYPEGNTAYEGIFSVSDLQTIIAYANQNKITVLPEMDFPGHARAIVQADTTIFVDPNDTSFYVSVQGYYDDVVPVCLYNNTTPLNGFTNTMNNFVLGVSQLFANQTTIYWENEVSLGADEVSTEAWTSDTTCSTNSSWSSLNALSKSHYFFNLIAAANNPIKISGYQQLVQNNDTIIDTESMPPSDVGHIWVWNTVNSPPSSPDGAYQAIALAQASYPTVLSFANDLYFDLTYTPNAWEPGFYWAGSFLDTHAALNSASDTNYVLNALTTPQQAYIVGLEGALWGENMMTFRHMAYMALPKMAGLAEAAWSQNAVISGQLNWQSLATRLGTTNNGFLNYLYTITGLQYRGYPNGISLEIPN